MQRLSRSERVVQKLEQIALRDGDTDGTQVRALNFWARRWGCSSTEWRPRTRRHEMRALSGLNWKHG
jgi:hypothetical protein